jgi:excisionase family DNA binding protein
MDQAGLVQRLTSLAARMRADGHAEMATDLDALAAEVRASSETWPGDLLTPAEAAVALGVHSVNTIKRWARDGQLEGYHIGGRILVSRRSVEAFQHASTLKRQRTFERDLDAALAPFDATAEEAAALTEGTPTGRTPWRTNAAAPTTS